MRRLSTGSEAGPRRLAWRLRRAMAGEITRRAPPAVAAFLLTVALGQRTEVAESVEDGFRAAGATHVLSVSGLHLAAVAGLVFFFVRRIAGAVPALALRAEIAFREGLAGDGIRLRSRLDRLDRGLNSFQLCRIGLNRQIRYP